MIISRIPGTPPGSLGPAARRAWRCCDPETGEECPRARLRRDRRGDQPRRGDRRAREHHRHRPVRRLLQRRGARPPSGCAAGCTGAATSPTATPTGSSTTPAAPPTGCASTARTSPPPRSSGSCCGTRTSPRRRCTPYPTRASATSSSRRWCCTTTPPSTRDAFEEFLAAQPDLGPKQWPRYVRILDALPRTATNKVLKRELVREGLDVDRSGVGPRRARAVVPSAL